MEGIIVRKKAKDVDVLGRDFEILYDDNLTNTSIKETTTFILRTI